MRLNNSRFLLLMIAALLFVNVSVSFHAAAQQAQQPKSKCPVTKVTCPDSVEVGEKLTFTAEVSGGDSQVTPTFNWTVSASSIESGQGTPTIEVGTNELAGGSTVTATVDIGGFARECGYGSTAASCTASVVKKPDARKLDEYGKLKSMDENARLDNFVIELQTDPQAQGHIIAYGGRASRAGDAEKAARQARDYIVNKRGLEAERVVTVNGGYRQQPAIELWLVPLGAQSPQPTPTVKRVEAKPVNPAKPKKPGKDKGRKM